MYFSTSTIAMVAALAATTSAHMNMADPPPLMYKGNPNAKTIDYSITAPNTADTFPCKGALSVFDTDEGASVATWAPGSQQTITLEGGAAHDGGSCQVSLSYDSGKTWTAIYSKEGGCPTTPSLSFTVPSDTPAADKVLLGWSWINHTGNREFYMNCASITISGSSSKREERVRRPAKRETAFKDRPAMFVAQFPTISEYCVAEGFDAAYPSPGPDMDVDSAAKTVAPTICSGASVTATIATGSSPSTASAAAGTTTAAAAGTTTTAAAGTTTSAATSTATAAATSSASLYVSSSLSSPQGTFSTKGPFVNSSTVTSATASTPTELTIIPITKSGSSSVLIGSPSSTGGVFLTVPASGSSSSSSAAAQTTTLATKTTAAGGASTSVAPTKSSSAAPSTGSGAASGTQSGACTDEGAWACDSTGSNFQRCASGAWSAAMPMAAGTSCTPGISDTLSMQRRRERYVRRSFGDYHL